MVFSHSIDLPLLGSSIDHTLECIVAITLIWYRLSMHGYLICRHCEVVTLTAGRWDVRVRIDTDLSNFTFLLFLRCPTLNSIQESRCNICLVKMSLWPKWHSVIAQDSTVSTLPILQLSCLWFPTQILCFVLLLILLLTY